MKLVYSVILTLLSFAVYAQNTITAKVLDKSDQTGIALAGVKLTPTDPKMKPVGGFTTVEGNLTLDNVPGGSYQLIITSIGYETFTKPIRVRNGNVDLGTLLMSASSIMTDEVEVKAKQTRVTVKGDTTQFNADAYKVNPDASAEDLIRKLPGVQIENGAVKAQGESVKRVLIDGKEFFGSDPSLALKNLPAEIISKIEVFDRQSDQARFSGIENGETDKTINIITRSGKSNGQFGKIFGGYGTDDRYSAGGNMNYFKGDTRLSIIGLANNVNQQNFASDDLLGALGVSGGGGRGRRGGGGSSGANPDDFRINGQGGLTTTNALGFNYIDKWGKKIEVSASYFVNRTDNFSQDTLSRITFVDADRRQFYEEGGNNSNVNVNHRISSRFTYNINKTNELVFTPNISFQKNERFDFFQGQTQQSTGELLNDIFSNRNSNGSSYNLRANLTYRHRFEKRGRTFSVGVGADTRTSNSDGSLLSENNTFLPRPRATLIDQISTGKNVNNGYEVRLDYSEPLSEKSQLSFSYRGDFNASASDQKTLDKDVENNVYNRLNPVLSNSFDNDYDRHTGTVSYRYSVRNKISFGVNADLQQALLASEQTFPNELTINRNFTNLLPSSYVRYEISKTKNLRVYYRSSTNAPSINQLQNVVNNSNPLRLRAGNPNLIQENSHRLSFRYNSTNTENATSLYTSLNAGMSNNNISNSVFTAVKDTLFRGVLLARGSQLTLPINYGQTYNASTFTSFGFPLAWLKSNINLNLGINYNQTPTLLNGNENVADNLGINSGVVVGSNISEFVDFTVSYNGGYNVIKNSLSPQLNNNYYSQNVSLKLNLLSRKGFFFNTEGINTLYNGLGADFDQNFTLLNVSVGQKFMKNDRGELKLTAFDILNQNTSVNRNVTESYIEDRRSFVLNRYYMLTFTYNLRNFR